jgi:hypothetical protein
LPPVEFLPDKDQTLLRYKGDAVRINNLHFQKLVWLDFPFFFVSQRRFVIFFYLLLFFRNNCIGTTALKTASLSGFYHASGAYSSVISRIWEDRQATKARALRALSH